MKSMDDAISISFHKSLREYGGGVEETNPKSLSVEQMPKR
jgi:hypothetical protein